MTTCETCSKQYDHSSKLWLGGEIQAFDSFECAFYAIAPICACCNRRLVGQGIEAGGIFFCCAHCALDYEAVVGFQDDAYQYTPGIIHALDEALC